MKTNSLRTMASVCAMATALAVPHELLAEPQTAGQRAGEVSRVIPTVNIARGPKSLSAAAKTVVDWQDVVNTQVNARARLSLDDGSVLNVGADSSVRVTRHDSGAQQTDLELSLGKMRSQAQKITQPNGKFEVRTPAGVAGVVGTDFYTAYENNVMTVIVFEGVVKVCNLAGVCVFVKAGQMSTVRSGDDSAPTLAQASLTTLTDAIAATNLQGPSPVQQAHHISKGTAIALGIVAIVPAIVIPIVATRGTSPQPTQPTRGQCPPTSPNCVP